MGVPKFYRWISERYPCLSETVKEFQIPEFDNLYLDMNGIIHVCSHPEDDNPHFRITEEKIFSDIMHYLEFLFRMIKPRKVFFMAVDGVAPRAKMNQQRGRRFRSAREAEELERKAKEKGETLPTEKRFDSNCITPGTPFMVRLQEQLKYFVVKKLSTDPLWHGVRVYLSGHETPGEGEHKIMDFIRHERSQTGYDPNTRHCLYGLDADLMMLGLATHDPHFSLLREEVRFGGKKDKHKRPTTAEETTFHLLHLSLFREYLDFEFSALKESLPFPYNLESVIDDWVLMGFLVGNDFIPHLPNLHINHDALPLLWKTYIDVLPSCGGYINEGGYLNLERFEKYIVALSQFDFDTFSEQAGDLKWLEGKKAQSDADKAELISAARKFRKNMKKEENRFAAFANNSEDLEDSTGEEKIDESYDLSPEEISEEILSDEDSGDTLGDEFRHHKRYYYMTKMDYQKVTPEVLKDQAEGYVRGLQWILLYYYEGVPSWSWFYPHHYAPYMSDVKDFKNMNITFDLGTPFLPFEQLMAVLPAASKELLPPPFQTLMTMDSSPVIDFYPLNFDTDLNGKQQDWEAVVLIPFIDENRLLTAMKTKESLLSADEKSRNCHGPCLLYEYNQEPSGVYPSSLPDAFPDIAINHSRLTKIAKDGLILPSHQLVKGLLPGVKLDVYYAGFPTLKHIPHSAELKKEGVKVFQMNSRGFNVMLNIKEQDTPDIRQVAKDYLGREIFVGWPHLYEAKVIAVCDDITNYSLVETKETKGKKSSQPEKRQLKKDDNDENTTNTWYREVHSIKEKYKDRLGINIGDTDILIRALPMTGRKYVFGSHGRVTLEKQFGNRPVPFALQATVKDIAVHDSSFCQFKTLKEYLPESSPVFMLGWPHYGCQGEVLEVDHDSGRVRINLSIFEEPKLTSIINNQTLHAERYMLGFVAAQRLGISSNILSRITGTILVGAGEQELAEQQQNPHKVNIGLNLKFTKKGEEVPGYTKMSDGQWTYSQKVVDLVTEYLQKFPEMFDNICKSNNKGNDIFYESQLIPASCSYNLKDVSEYIKSLPCSSIKPMKSGADIISEGTISALQDEAKRVVEINKKRQKRVKMQVKPHLLFRHVSTGGAIIPDSTTMYQLFDRVVNIRQGYAVPFGLRGTVVGIHPADVEVNTVYEVIFDEEFMGGISIRDSSNRGYRMPPSSLLNLTHGERKNGVKPAITQPDLNSQPYGAQQNRNTTGNRNYSEMAGYGRGNQYNQGYDARNQTGYGGYQDNRGGYYDNQGGRRGQDDRYKNPWNPQQGSSRSGQESYTPLRKNENRVNRNSQPPESKEDLSGKIFNGGSSSGSQPTFVTPKLARSNSGTYRPDTLPLNTQNKPQEKQASDEFSNMWKQLQSASDSGQGTSLSEAAAVLPKVTKPDANNSNMTKLDVDSLFSQASQSMSTDQSESNKSMAQSNSSAKDKKDAKPSTKVVSNDEFAAMFKSLEAGQAKHDEEMEDKQDEDESADMIKKMLHIGDQTHQDPDQPVQDGAQKVSYGRQVSLQELFDGAKQQHGPADKSQPQSTTEQQQQQKRGKAGSSNKQKQQQGQQQSTGHQQGLHPPPLMQQQVHPSLQQRPPLMMSPNQGGNRNPVMELMSFCQSLQIGIPIYDYIQKGGMHYSVVTMQNGARYQGSLCRTREEAAESAAGVALLQMKGSMHQMPVHPIMRQPGYTPGVMLPQGRQFSSPNSAFSPVSNFAGFQGPMIQGQYGSYNQRSYHQGHQGQGQRGGAPRQQYFQNNSYYGNSGQQNYQNQGRHQNHQNYNNNNNNNNSSGNSKNNQNNRQTEKPADSQQTLPDVTSTNQKAKIGLTNQNEGKTKPTSVVTPFVPLQVTKKQTPQKQRKESTSDDTTTKSGSEHSPPTDSKVSPSNFSEHLTENSENVGSDKQISDNKNAEKITDTDKTPQKNSAENLKEKTPSKKTEPKTPGSGKKPKRRLAANFNFNN